MLSKSFLFLNLSFLQWVQLGECSESSSSEVWLIMILTTMEIMLMNPRNIQIH